METERALSEDLYHHCCEYPVVLAYRRPPVQRLTGVVRMIREGPRAPAQGKLAAKHCHGQKHISHATERPIETPAPGAYGAGGQQEVRLLSAPARHEDLPHGCPTCLARQPS